MWFAHVTNSMGDLFILTALNVFVLLVKVSAVILVISDVFVFFSCYQRCVVHSCYCFCGFSYVINCKDGLFMLSAVHLTYSCYQLCMVFTCYCMLFVPVTVWFYLFYQLYL